MILIAEPEHGGEVDRDGNADVVVTEVIDEIGGRVDRTPKEFSDRIKEQGLVSPDPVLQTEVFVVIRMFAIVRPKGIDLTPDFGFDRGSAGLLCRIGEPFKGSHDIPILF